MGIAKLVGTQYKYSLLTDNESEWKRDLRLIKNLGMSTVKIWIGWKYLSSEEGKYNWDPYDKLLKLVKANGFNIIVQLHADAPQGGEPEWVKDNYPETTYVNEDAGKGFIGACFDNEVTKGLWNDYIKNVVNRYNDYADYWDIWNEISHISPCYCKATEEKFKIWLEGKYKSIDKLNDNWHTSYKDFNSVEIPHEKWKLSISPAFFDIYEFTSFSIGEQMAWRAECVTKVSPGAKIISHIGTVIALQNYVDPWLLTKSLDIWGTSTYMHDHYEKSLTFDVIRSSSRGKPWWLAEHTGNIAESPDYFWLGETKATGLSNIKSTVFLAYGLGAGANMFWCWKDGIYGLLDYGGKLSERTKFAQNLTKACKKHKNILSKVAVTDSKIGLLWEQRSYILDYYFTKCIKKEELGRPNMLGYYGALTDAGLRVDILNTREIAEKKKIPGKIKVLFAPYQITSRGNIHEMLMEWVTRGNILVAGPFYEAYEPEKLMTSRNDFALIEELFGVRPAGVFHGREFKADLTSSGITTGIDSLESLSSIIETYEVNRADVIGVSKGKPVITIKKHGKGYAIMVGLFLGKYYIESGRTSGAKGSLSLFLKNICSLGGIYPEVEVTGNAFGRVLRSGKNIILFLHNPTCQHVEVSAEIPGINMEGAVDFLDNRKYNITDKKTINTTLNPRDSKIVIVTCPH